MTMETLIALCDAWAGLAPEVQAVLRTAARADEPFDDACRTKLGEAVCRAQAGRSMIDGREWAFRTYLEADSDDLRAEAAIVRAKYGALLDALCDQVIPPGLA